MLKLILASFIVLLFNCTKKEAKINDVQVSDPRSKYTGTYIGESTQYSAPTQTGYVTTKIRDTVPVSIVNNQLQITTGLSYTVTFEIDKLIFYAPRKNGFFRNDSIYIDETITPAGMPSYHFAGKKQ
jgi:hypothetical protein